MPHRLRKSKRSGALIQGAGLGLVLAVATTSSAPGTPVDSNLIDQSRPLAIRGSLSTVPDEPVRHGIEPFSEAAGYTLRLGADRARQNRAEADLEAARAAFLPSVQLGGEWAFTGDRTYHPRNLRDLSPEAFPDRDPSIIALEASLTIYDGSRRLNMMRAAQAMVAAGLATTADTRQRLFLDSADAALAVIRDREIVARRGVAVSRQRHIYDATRQRLIDQTVTLTDVALAAAQYDQSRAALAAARGEAAASEIAYRMLLGRIPPARIRLEIPAGRLPRSAAEAASRAEKGAPSIVAARRQTDAARFKLDAARSAYYPTVELVGRAGSTFDQSESVDQIDNYAGLVRVRIPIFDPTIRPGISKATAEADQSFYASESARLEAASAARTAFAARESSMREAAELQRQIVNARKAVDGMRIERELGTRLLTDVLSAEASLAEAEIIAARLTYTTRRSAFALLAAMGEIDVGDVPEPLTDGLGTTASLASD